MSEILKFNSRVFDEVILTEDAFVFYDALKTVALVVKCDAVLTERAVSMPAKRLIRHAGRIVSVSVDDGSAVVKVQRGCTIFTLHVPALKTDPPIALSLINRFERLVIVNTRQVLTALEEAGVVAEQVRVAVRKSFVLISASADGREYEAKIPATPVISLNDSVERVVDARRAARLIKVLLRAGIKDIAVGTAPTALALSSVDGAVTALIAAQN